jgi:hypothetical protein
MNCGPLSEMIRGCASGYSSVAPGDDLDIGLGHRFAQIQIHDVAATAVQNAAQVGERKADVAVGHVDVPKLLSRRAGSSDESQ